MKQYLMPSYGEIMKHALTCKAIGAEVCSSVWCEFVLVKVNMNQLGVILYLNMYVCKFEPIQHVFRQKAFCKESILFHSYTLFYSLQRGQGIFIAINYTHVFSGDPRIPMKEERNIITMDGQGNISLPSDIGATAMTEREICELFGVIAPTVRAGIKALCKSGVLSIYDIKHIIRLSDKYSAEVYNLETIAALAFRVESFGAAKVRRALLERIIHGRKEKTTVFVSVVSDGKPNSRWKA